MSNRPKALDFRASALGSVGSGSEAALGSVGLGSEAALRSVGSGSEEENSDRKLEWSKVGGLVSEEIFFCWNLSGETRDRRDH